MILNGEIIDLKECNICGDLEFIEVLTFDKIIFSDGNISKGKLAKEECQTCGTVRTNNNLNLQEFYSNSYQPSRNKDTLVISNKESINRSEFIYRWIKELIPVEEYIKFESILEIGCGQGYLLNKFGVEPSKNASSNAKKNIQNIRNIGYEELNNNEKYDFILSYCVIEHLNNPRDFIYKNYQILNEKGIMCIALPIQDKFNYDLVFSDHLYHFNHSNFKKLLQDNGFEIINYELGRKSYFNIAMYICKKVNNLFKDDFNFVKNQNIQILKKIFQNIEKINLLVLVNPTHYEAIKNLYKNFTNINFIDIFKDIKISEL